MGNILKPVGFILILGAVAAGAYYLGQSDTGKTGVIRAKQMLSGGTGTATAGTVDPNTPAGQGAPATPTDPAVGTAGTTGTKPTATTTTTTSTPRPRKPKAATTTSAPVERATVADGVGTTVSPLAGDLVRTRAGAKVRLLGVRTPTEGTDAKAAQDELAKLLGDGTVKIQLTADRSAALVWKDGLLVNESMVRRGWSRAGDSRFLTAEAAAKSQGAGLWSPDGWMGE